MITSIQYVENLKKVLDSFPHASFEKLKNEFARCAKEGRQIFVFGNGGSASTASHWACDINKCCFWGAEKKRFKMICLNDAIPTMLAYSNDVSYDVIFSEQLKNICQTGDLVIGISGSGNSKNIIKGIEAAKEHGAITAGIVGYSGGKVLPLVDIALHIAVDDMQYAEDCHLLVVHMIMKSFM
jgi:D-sedoheptulose 7-phosphate isomerase